MVAATALANTDTPELEDTVQDRISSEAASAMLGRGVRTLYRWSKEGIGPPRYTDGYRNFYLRHEVEAYLDAQINPQT